MDIFSIGGTNRTPQEVEWSPVCGIFTDPTAMLVQSISCNVGLLSVLL